MEQFKHDIYLKEKGEPFKFIKPASINPIQKVISHLNIDCCSDNLFISLEKKLKYYDCPDGDTYNLSKILNEIGVAQNGKTYIYWDNDNIDKIETEILVREWDYIWYDVSDDGIILFIDDSRVIMITHYGRVYYK